MHSAKRLVNMSTRARRRQSASARVGMFASRCLFGQLSKNQVLLHLERSDWFCIIPCGRLGPLRPLRGSRFALRQPDAFGAGESRRAFGADPSSFALRRIRAEGKIGLAPLKSHLKAKIPADRRAAFGCPAALGCPAIRKWWHWSRMVALVNTAEHWYFSSCRSEQPIAMSLGR